AARLSVRARAGRARPVPVASARHDVVRRAGRRILDAARNRRAGARLRGEVALLAGAVAVAVAADAVGAVAAGAVAERRARVAEQRLALLGPIAGQIARAGVVVRLAGRHVAARAGAARNVARLALALALDG